MSPALSRISNVYLFSIFFFLSKAVAFVVPLHDQDDSLIKKHPPKRFQRLEEQQTSPAVITHKMLQDKLAEAEQRRLQVQFVVLEFID